MARTKSDQIPQYVSSDWDRTISSTDHPNFWKFGVADLIFLDEMSNRKLVLDLGCGTGGSTLSLASKGKTRWIVGVDVMRAMIEAAKKKAVGNGLDNRVCFIVCDGRHLPFTSSSFDGLVSRGDAFCFLVPLKATVQELKRVMKYKGLVLLEMDNRLDWKPGTTISTGFQKTRNGETAYYVATFTKKRNYESVSYILNPNSNVAKEVANDKEFQEKGRKPSRHSLREIEKEAIETRRAAPTHWCSCRGLIRLFKRGGFKEVKVLGDGLLMNLQQDSDRTVFEEMRENPQLFFELERRLVPYIKPENAPTMILRATAP